MEKKKIYGIITLVFIFISIILLTAFDIKNNVQLSLAIQIILILFLIKISYGCILYIRGQYKMKKYSYGIVMNLGLLVFLLLNIIRQINLLIVNFRVISIVDIYNNTLQSFTYFSKLILPFILLLSFYSIATNITLIKKEGFCFQNLLGFFFSITVLICTFSGQLIYMFTNSLNLVGINHLIKIIIDISINATCSYLYCLILATLYCNIMASKHIPSYDKDFVIILGSQIMDDGTLTPLLKGRADKAIAFGKKQKEETNKEIIYIPSGGKGHDEIISEGDAIKNYLIEQGIDNKQIIVENKSTNTNENMRFSKNIILKINKKSKTIFSTTNYHVFRSGVVATDEGLECEGIGSKTTWYFYTNALIREFIANLVKQRKEHITLILIIIVSLLVFIFIGYFNNFIN